MVILVQKKVSAIKTPLISGQNSPTGMYSGEKKTLKTYTIRTWAAETHSEEPYMPSK